MSELKPITYADFGHNFIRQVVNAGRLRKEIEPCTAADLMRFLFRWQHTSTGAQLHGVQGVAHVVEQLEGLEAAAGAWEAEILPARVERYRPEWIDSLCLSGEVWWGRRARESHEHLGHAARDIASHLGERGASFAAEITAAVGRLPSEISEGLWELVAAGLATADGFASLRALLDGRGGRSPSLRKREWPARIGRASRDAGASGAVAVFGADGGGGFGAGAAGGVPVGLSPGSGAGGRAGERPPARPRRARRPR
jgi:ATP-dependent Lhr-like helicase